MPKGRPTGKKIDFCVQSGQEHINKENQGSKEKLKNQLLADELANVWRSLKNIIGYSRSPPSLKRIGNWQIT